MTEVLAPLTCQPVDEVFSYLHHDLYWCHPHRSILLFQVLIMWGGVCYTILYVLLLSPIQVTHPGQGIKLNKPW